MDNLGEDFRAKIFQLPNATNYENATFWRRVGAFLLDLLVINFIIIGPFSDVFTPFLDAGIFGAEALPDHVYTSVIIISILALLYFSLMQHYAQQTIGMMILGMYVIPRPGFWRSVARNLYILPFFPFNILWIVEPLYLYLKGRRLLERITKTDTVTYHG